MTWQSVMASIAVPSFGRFQASGCPGDAPEDHVRQFGVGHRVAVVQRRQRRGEREEPHHLADALRAAVELVFVRLEEGRVHRGEREPVRLLAGVMELAERGDHAEDEFKVAAQQRDDRRDLRLEGQVGVDAAEQ
ncbi:MAG: hypothetical protein H7146_06710 [Burkholderiaceae bacterium]|nr:hypothetical protein [Microbacteriaceae bacterium]